MTTLLPNTNARSRFQMLRRRFTQMRWFVYSLFGISIFLSSDYLNQKAKANLSIAADNGNWATLQTPQDEKNAPKLYLVAFPVANILDVLRPLGISKNQLSDFHKWLGVGAGDRHHYALQLIDNKGQVFLFEAMFEHRPDDPSQMPKNYVDNLFGLPANLRLATHDFGNLKPYIYRVDAHNPAWPIQGWTKEEIQKIAANYPKIEIARGQIAQRMWDSLPEIAKSLEDMSLLYGVGRIDSNSGVLYVFNQWRQQFPELDSQLKLWKQPAPRLPMMWGTAYSTEALNRIRHR